MLSSFRKLKPSSIRLEAATVCQLRCPLCSTTAGRIGKQLGSGFLRFEDFKTLIDRNPWVCDVELSNWGEIFLNPDLLEIITYAHARHVTLRADNGVNLNTVSEEQLEALVKYRVRSLTCSIDGASQETYARYRKQGHFASVIKHLQRLNAYKAQYKSAFPLLKWQFIVFGHNEHEIPLARQMAKELRMSFWLKFSYDDTFSPVRNREFVRRESGLEVASEEEFRKKYRKPYLARFICTELWKRPQINFDGKVLGCCVNYWGDFGNAFTEGLAESLNNEKIRYARQMLLGERASRADIPCTTCRYYQRMKADRTWLQAHEVRGVRRSRFMNRLVNRFVGPQCMRLISALFVNLAIRLRCRRLLMKWRQ